MTSAAKSIFFFGLYLGVAGLSLFVAPNLVLGLLGIQSTAEIWIHLVGALTFILGVFFVYLARKEARPFFYISMFGRGTFILAVAILIGFYGAPYALGLFALADLAGLVWTLFAYIKTY